MKKFWNHEASAMARFALALVIGLVYPVLTIASDWFKFTSGNKWAYIVFNPIIFLAIAFALNGPNLFYRKMDGLPSKYDQKQISYPAVGFIAFVTLWIILFAVFTPSK